MPKFLKYLTFMTYIDACLLRGFLAAFSEKYSLNNTSDRLRKMRQKKMPGNNSSLKDLRGFYYIPSFGFIVFL